MPRVRRGKSQPRRERAFNSLQRTVSRASFDTQIIPGTLALVLTSFAPTVATPVVVTPGKLSLVLSEFAPVVATPRVVTPGKLGLTLTGFAPRVATPRVVTPGRLSLTLTAFAPTVTATANISIKPAAANLTLTGFTPTVTATANVLVTPAAATLTLTGFVPTTSTTANLPVIGPYHWVFVSPVSPGASGITTLGKLLRETEVISRPLPFKVPHHELPVAPEPLEVQFVTPRIDNSTAFAALFESGALTEDEFIALIAV